MNHNELFLRLTPKDALNAMLVYENDFKQPVYGLEPSEPEVVSGVRTKVKLTGHTPVASDDPYPYTGSTEFTYNRLDVQSILDGLLADYRPELPTTTQVLLEELHQITGIVFDVSDFVHETVTRTSSQAFKLKAKIESLRWHGNITIKLADLKQISAIVPASPPYTFGTNDDMILDPNVLIGFSAINHLAFSEFISGGIRGYLAGPLSQPVQNWPPSALQGFITMIAAALKPAMPSMADAAWTWYTPTPRPFNVYNARILEIDGEGQHPYLKRLNPKPYKYIKIQLDPHYSTALTNDILYIWYCDSMDDEEMVATPYPTIVLDELSPFNGENYAAFFSTLTVGQLLNTINPSTMLLDVHNPNYTLREWKCVHYQTNGETWPIETNLYHALVHYNGPNRLEDNTSIYPHLTRVVELSLNEEFCSIPLGNMKIYY